MLSVEGELLISLFYTAREYTKCKHTRIGTDTCTLSRQVAASAIVWTLTASSSTPLRDCHHTSVPGNRVVKLTSISQTLRFPPRHCDRRRWYVLLRDRRVPREQPAAHRRHLCATECRAEDRGLCQDARGEGWREEALNGQSTPPCGKRHTNSTSLATTYETIAIAEERASLAV